MATNAPITGAPTRAPSSYRPSPHLLHAIARLYAAKGISETSFGRDAVGDPRLVSDLRTGRQLREKTREKVIAHMAALAAANPPRVRRRPVVAVTADTMQEAFAQLVDMSPRQDVEAAVDMLIERLDHGDSDPDLEDSEGGGQVDERGRYLGGDVAAAQDEDREPDDDAQGDVSWPEWQTRGRHKLTANGAEAATHAITGWQHHEDDEDDDPIEANGDEQDSNCAEDEAGIHIHRQDVARIPGCPIADAPEPTLGATEESAGNWGGTGGAQHDGEDEPDDFAARAPHRDRIRRERCDVYVRYGNRHYGLKRGSAAESVMAVRP